MPRAEYMHVSDRKRHAHYRQVAEDILGGRCVVCGTDEGVEFDHIDPTTKRFNLADGHSVTMTVYLEEVAKCQPLCKPHHHEKTWAQRGFPLVKGQDVHGTLAAYRYCRCGACRAAKSADNAARNRARGIGPRPLRVINHGEYGMYRKGCRCTLCREANAERVRTYNRKAAQTR